MSKPYSCPNCHKRFSIKHLFFLGNFSELKCKKCEMYSKPEKMSNKYLSFGFLSTATPFEVVRYTTKSYKYGLIAALACGLAFYLSVLIYVYNTVKFRLL